MSRHAPKKGAIDLLQDDPGVWVPAYTYDITKMEDPHAFGREVQKRGGSFQWVGWKPGRKPPESALQGQRARWEDTPATFEGAVLLAGDPGLYKVRGKPGLYRTLVRQGCEGQRLGMRLRTFSFTREEALVDGKLPSTRMHASEMRKLVKPAISTEDLLP
ncbi:MAG: hypothetical protein KJ872_12525 [Alphaproteobacteria bacterium]|nr:hypothetical protein [Alphaproteobacteria bacterium]